MPRWTAYSRILPAGAILELTRPSLQLRDFASGCCARVAVCDCVRYILDAFRGIRANSLDCACSSPSALAPGCLDKPDRASACRAANAAVARSGRQAGAEQ
jgi:hypothetical protein